MKKVIICIFILILLTSCNNRLDITESGEDHDEYGYSDEIYFYSTGQRINAKTGAVTYICSDPLCDHDKNECLPMQIDPLMLRDVLEYNNCLYYSVIKTYHDYTNPLNVITTHTYHIAEYDIENNETKILFDVDNSWNTIQLYDHYLYFGNFITEEAEDGSIYKTLTISKIDVINKTKEPIVEGLTDIYSFCDVDDQYLYFRDSLNMTYYRIDMNGENKESVDQTELPSNQIGGDYSVYIQTETNEAGQVVKRNLCSYNKASKVTTVIAEDVLLAEIHAYNGYIYYTKNVPESETTKATYLSSDGTSSTGATAHGGKIYRIKPDGSGEELVYDGGAAVKFQFNGSFMMFTGRYMAVWGTDFTQNADGVYVSNLAEDEAYRVLIVDLVTKESKWVGIKKPGSSETVIGY